MKFQAIVMTQLEELLLAILSLKFQQQKKFSHESSVEYRCEAVSYVGHLIFLQLSVPFFVYSKAKLGLL